MWLSCDKRQPDSRRRQRGAGGGHVHTHPSLHTPAHSTTACACAADMHRPTLVSLCLAVTLSLYHPVLCVTMRSSTRLSMHVHAALQLWTGLRLSTPQPLITPPPCNHTFAAPRSSHRTTVPVAQLCPFHSCSEHGTASSRLRRRGWWKSCPALSLPSGQKRVAC